MKSLTLRALLAAHFCFAPAIAFAAAPLTTTPAALPGYIAGLLPSSITGTSTTAALSIGGGGATDSTNSTFIYSGPTLSWSVTHGNSINGYDLGTTLSGSSTIHFYICSGSSGVGSFASSSTSPTCPVGYNAAYRRIFDLNTTAAGALIPGNAIEGPGGSEIFYLTTQVTDSGSLPNATPVQIRLSQMPAGGIRVQPLIRLLQPSSSSNPILVLSGDETTIPTVSSYNTAPSFDEFGVNSQVWSGFVTTNATGQIIVAGFINSGSINYGITQRGWIDYRRN